MDADLITDPEALAALQPEWEDLLARCGRVTPFMTPAWLTTWWKHFGRAGALLTRVIYTKQQGEKRFVIVDAGMTDLIRPTLYQAYHPILLVEKNGSRKDAKNAKQESLGLANLASLPELSSADEETVDIVGPICETSDFLARERPMPPVAAGDLLAVAARFGSFPVLLETFRECLRDVFDMPALVDTLLQIRKRAVKVAVVTPESPSPFAAWRCRREMWWLPSFPTRPNWAPFSLGPTCWPVFRRCRRLCVW